MAIVIDNSKSGTVSREFLVQATECMWQRLLAFWIDLAIIFILFLPILLNNDYILWLSFIAIILYFPLFEGLSGYTVGKYICRIKVINSEGKIPGIGRAVIRTLLRILEVNPALLGAIPAGVAILCSKTKQRFGDMLAHTYVVRVENLIAIQSSQERGEPKIDTEVEL